MAASLAVAASGFLPWSRTGRSRSGLELARALRDVGLAERASLRLLLVLFFFTPLLAAAVWIAAVTGRRFLVAVLGAVVGGIGLSASSLVRASSLRTEVGVDFALVAVPSR